MGGINCLKGKRLGIINEKINFAEKRNIYKYRLLILIKLLICKLNIVIMVGYRIKLKICNQFRSCFKSNLK